MRGVMVKKRYINDLINKMTLDEKIGQFNMQWTINNRMDDLSKM